MSEFEITIVTKIHDAEDPEKVKECILNVFPDAQIERKGAYIVGHTTSIPKKIENLKKWKGRRSIIFPIRKDHALKGEAYVGMDEDVSPIWVEVRGNVEEIVSNLSSR